MVHGAWYMYRGTTGDTPGGAVEGFNAFTGRQWQSLVCYCRIYVVCSIHIISVLSLYLSIIVCVCIYLYTYSQ